MERYYFKCTFCERPFAMNLEYKDVTDLRTQVRNIQLSACPLCNTPEVVKVMGRVQKTNIVRTGVKAACDLRCTNAVGPKCDCLCGNVNHGTYKLVTYNKVVGKLEVVNKEMLKDNEFYLLRVAKLANTKRNLITLIKATCELKYNEILYKIKEGRSSWNLSSTEYDQYTKCRSIMYRLNKIENLFLVKRKVTELAKLYADVR